MDNKNDKNETEMIKLKKVPIEKNHKMINYKLYQVVIIIALFTCIYILSFYFIYKRLNYSYQSQLQEKNNIIENIKEQLNKINPQFSVSRKNLNSMEREFLYDNNFFMSNKMYASNDNKGNGNSYNIYHIEYSYFGKRFVPF